jgi:putative ABC transport system substrate-binding protein
LPELVADLIRHRVNVIVTLFTTAAAQAAKATTSTIPIVFSVGDDPVKHGLVSSLSQPGGNVTGVNFFSAEVTAKRLGLLHEFLPEAARIGVLVNPTNVENTERTVKDVKSAADHPSDLPVVQSTKFKLAVNLRTAKAFGLEVPATLLSRADEVIE